MDKCGCNDIYVVDTINRKVHALISNNNWKIELDQVPTQLHNTVKKIKIHNHIQKDYWYGINIVLQMSTCTLLAILNKLNR